RVPWLARLLSDGGQILLSIAAQNGRGNRSITKENQDGYDARHSVEERPVSGILPAERLEHAADPMAQVQGEQRHAENIKSANPDILEANHHHPENIVALCRIREVHEILSSQVHVFCLHGEME